MIDVPNPANRSIRRLTVSIATGSEVLSYSLQYLQDRLQRRIGTMCARIGCFVESNPRDMNLASRISAENFFMKNRLSLLFFLIDIITGPFFLPRLINLLCHRFPGEMSRASGADDHELLGGVEGLLDAEIFPFAWNLRLSFIINQALSPRAEIAEPDFDPSINRIFSQ